MWARHTQKAISHWWLFMNNFSTHPSNEVTMSVMEFIQFSPECVPRVWGKLVSIDYLLNNETNVKLMQSTSAHIVDLIQFLEHF